MLFVNELASLQTEITTFEAIITAKRQQIEQFNQAQVVANGAIEALQNAITNIEQLAPLALATLKSSVISLFSDGGTDGNGDFEPGPTPEPGLNGESCEIDLDVHWEKAQPDGTYWDLASTLACRLSDAPSESIHVQSVDHACDAENKLAEFVELVRLNEHVAYQRRYDGVTKKPDIMGQPSTRLSVAHREIFNTRLAHNVREKSRGNHRGLRWRQQ